MAKRIFCGRYLPADLKNEADIPLQVDMTTGGAAPNGYIDCNNINTAIIRNVLGESSNSVSVLCKSNKINKWARWKPGVSQYSNYLPTVPNGVVITLAPPGECKMGDFAGYNHQETTKPTYYATSISSDMGKYEFGLNQVLYRPELARGRMQPIYSGDVRAGIDESLWDLIKMQIWIDSGGGYSLNSTTGYIDFNDQTEKTLLNINDFAIGIYDVCVRPCYMDVNDGTTPLAVIEDGVIVFRFEVVNPASLWSVVDKGSSSNYGSGGKTEVTYDFDITRESTQARIVDIRLLASSPNSYFSDTYYFPANMDNVEFSGNQTKNFTGAFSLEGEYGIPSDTGLLEVQISINNGTNWYSVGGLTGTLENFH